MKRFNFQNVTNHRLTWHMRGPVFVYAATRFEAIRQAWKGNPLRTDGIQLYYGEASGFPVAEAGKGLLTTAFIPPFRTARMIEQAVKQAHWSASFHVAPRLTCGSPALVDPSTAIAVALEEAQALVAAVLSGAYGPKDLDNAMENGLDGVAYATWRSRSRRMKVRLDLITGEECFVPPPLSREARERARTLAIEETFKGVLPAESKIELAELRFAAKVRRETL